MIPKHLKPLNEKKYKELKEITHLFLHRIKLGNSPTDILNGFQGGVPEAAKVTGHKMPYHFLVEPDGEVTQCVSLHYQTPHARRWNATSYSVGMIGDFRRHAPPQAQWYATRLLALYLSLPINLDIIGHTEAPGASRPGKECPGKLWDMNRFREEVGDMRVLPGEVDSFWLRVRI